MSAIFDNSAKSLTATLGTAPAYATDIVVISAWLKWTTGQTHNSANYAVDLTNAGSARLSLIGNSSPYAYTTGGWNGAASVGNSTTAITDGTWYLHVGRLLPNVSAPTPTVSVSKDGGTTVTANSVYAAGETTDLSSLKLGQKVVSPSAFTPWKGSVAEVGIFTVADNTEYLALLAELTTKIPSACTNGALLWYAPLDSDATVDVGAALTNNGTVTFDGGDHPSLSGGATNYTLTADAASFTLAGNAATIKPYDWTATERTMPSSQDWNKVAHNGTVFCSVPWNSGVCATSSDGITWTSRTMPATRNWNGIATNGSIFVAIADGTDQAATSSDGITWTNRTLPSSAAWGPIAWNGSVFCVLDTAGTTKAATSSDGITWTARTMPNAAGWSGITAKGSTFCAVASFAPAGAAGSSTHAATSTDGITWTARTLPATADYRSITCNDTTFVASLDFSDFVATSADGVTWATPSVASALAWRTVGWNGTHFIAIARNSDVIATSPTGATWKAETMPASRNWQGFAANAAGLGVTVAGGATTVSATVTTVAAAGAAAFTLTAAVEAFTETGSAAGLYLNKKMAAALGTYAMTGVAVGDVVVPTGTVTSQPAPDGQTQQFVGTTTNAGSGEYTLVGSGGGVTVGPSAFTVTTNAFDFTAIELEPGGYAPLLRAVGTNYRAVMSGTSAFTINGVGGGGGFDATLTAEAASYALGGNAAHFNVTRPSAEGGYALTGNAATFHYARSMAAAVGGYALTGNDMFFSGEKILGVETGAFAVTGSDAALRYTKYLVAELATFFAPTRSAGLYHGRRMPAATDSFALNGADAALRKGGTVAAETQAYTTAGNAITFHRGYALAASTAACALTGIAATAWKTKYLQSDVGELETTFTDVGFTLSRRVVLQGVVGDAQLGGVELQAWGIISTGQSVEAWSEINT